MAVETPGRGLMPVTGLGIDCGNDPVGGDAPGDAEHLTAEVKVLAGHGGQQHDRLGDIGLKVTAVEEHQARVSVKGQLVHQRLADRGVVPSTDRFTGPPIVVVAGQHRPQLGFQVGIGDYQQGPGWAWGNQHRYLHRPARRRLRLSGERKRPCRTCRGHQAMTRRM